MDESLKQPSPFNPVPTITSTGTALPGPDICTECGKVLVYPCGRFTIEGRKVCNILRHYDGPACPGGPRGALPGMSGERQVRWTDRT